MKLIIDVDEKLVCEGFERIFTEEERNVLIRAIGNGIPYEERPHGKWKDITPNHYFTCGGEPLVVCPFCEDNESKHVRGIENHMWNFCPHCGADMREADNDK